MGLDSFFMKKLDEPDKDGNMFSIDENFPDLPLAVGIFSGGPGGFRGKCYNDIIQQITGESLYQHIISPEKVKEMSDKLEASTSLGELMESNGWVEEDITALQKAFKYASDNGLTLLGWW